MSARNATLERLIAENPDDSDSYLVYADWLSGRGDPRGELITVQHKRSVMSADERNGVLGADLAAREKAILDATPETMGLPWSLFTKTYAQWVHVSWRWGFLDAVHFDNEGEEDDDLDVARVATGVVESAVALVLRELRIGVMRWNHSEKDVPAILKAAAESPAGPQIRRIHIGDFGDANVDTAMYNPGKLEVFTNLFPALESLLIVGYEFTLGVFDLPALKSLEIKTCALQKEHLARVVEAKWPELERLELWFGSTSYGAACGVADLDAILDGSAFPKLTHLGLMNAEFTDDLPAALASSRVLKRLKSLDLSKGTMAADGARAMLAARTAFQHLESISVDENFLGEEILEQLREIGPTIVSTEQKEDDVSIPGEVHRYVSMHE